MDRILRNTQATVDIIIYGASGDATNVDDATVVTATVRDGAGVTVQTGPATHAATGRYLITAGPFATLDTFTVQWAFTLNGVAQRLDSEFATVGGFMFSIGELRAMPRTDFDNATKYPAWALHDVRAQIEEAFEHITGVTWCPHGQRDVLDGDGTSSLFLSKIFPTRVVACAVGGTAFGVTELANIAPSKSGLVRLVDGGTWPEGNRNVAMFYEHGMPSPPHPLRVAALIAAQEHLQSSPMSRRQLTETNEVGTIRYSIAGRDGHFGIPDVDAVLDEWSERAPKAG